MSNYVFVEAADVVCEDHFAPDSFDQIKGAFASELAGS